MIDSKTRWHLPRGNNSQTFPKNDPSWNDARMDQDDVYILYHLHSGNSGDQSVKLIGVYRSEASAVMAANRLKNLPGFKDFPEIIDHWSDDSAGLGSPQ